jgi:two-component system sensor histidine kinase RegB
MKSTSALSNLRRLFLLRNIVIAGQIVAIAAAVALLGTPLPVVPMGAVIGLLMLVNLRTRARLCRATPLGDAELFCELLADVICLTALLYLSGGSTNPFVSLYLLPLTIAATALPARYARCMAGLTVACYTLLLFSFRPLGHEQMHSSAFNLHVLGMWLTFLVSAALIASFVSTMSASIRARDQELAAARERALRDEQVLALGTFAAGAAHELGTPLATIAVLSRELEKDHAMVPGLREELQLLRSQVDICKHIITGLTRVAGQTRSEHASRQNVRAFVEGVFGKWALLRPQVRLTVLWSGQGAAPDIVGEETVRQSLISILNNAADASPEEVEVEASWSDRALIIEVRDRGPGITDEVSAHVGRRPISTKSGGRGIGLFLANATVERMGGSVALCNRDGGGGCTRVTIPLASGYAIA